MIIKSCDWISGFWWWVGTRYRS